MGMVVAEGKPRQPQEQRWGRELLMVKEKKAKQLGYVRW